MIRPAQHIILPRGAPASPILTGGGAGAAAETFLEHMDTYDWDVFYTNQDSGFPIDCGTGTAADDMVEDTSQAAGSPTFEGTGVLPGLPLCISWASPDNGAHANSVALSGLTKANMDANGFTCVAFVRALTSGQNGGYVMGSTGFSTIFSVKSDGDIQVRLECSGGVNAEVLTTTGPMTDHYTNDDDLMLAFTGSTDRNLLLYKGISDTLTDITEGAVQGTGGYHSSYGTASELFSMGNLDAQPRSWDGNIYGLWMSAQFVASSAELATMLTRSEL